MTAPSPDALERFRLGLLEALAPLVKAVRRLLEHLEPVAIRLHLSTRYGVVVRRCPIVPGSLVATSRRRLRAAEADEVRRLTARLRLAERRRDGEREATA